MICSSRQSAALATAARPEAAPQAPRSLAIDPRAKESPNSGCGDRLNEPARSAIMPGGKRAGRLDVDVPGRNAVAEPVGTFPASVDGTEHGMDPIAVAPGVLEPLEYQRDGAVTGRRALARRSQGLATFQLVSLRPDRASSCVPGQEHAEVAGKIDRAHDRRVELAALEPVAAIARAWMPEVSSQETVKLGPPIRNSRAIRLATMPPSEPVVRLAESAGPAAFFSSSIHSVEIVVGKPERERLVPSPGLAGERPAEVIIGRVQVEPDSDQDAG